MVNLRIRFAFTVMISVLALLLAEPAVALEPYCITLAQWEIANGKQIDLRLTDSSRVSGIVELFNAELQTLTLKSQWDATSVEYKYSEISEISYAKGCKNKSGLMSAGGIVGAVAGFFIANSDSYNFRSSRSNKDSRLMLYTLGGAALGTLFGASIAPLFPERERIVCDGYGN